MNESTISKQKSILTEVRERLGIYVYALVDPRSGDIFYVGKGKGDRILQHEKEKSDDEETASAKLKRIQEIELAGLAVKHFFIRTEIGSDDEAFAIEQAAIDALALAGISLTNIAAGHGSSTDGAVPLDEMLIKLAAPPTPAFAEASVVFKLNRMWKKNMTGDELGEITRGYWRVGADTRKEARYAIAVVFGVVRGVFKIVPGSWHQGNRLSDQKDRWGFEVEPAPELEHLVGTQMRDAFPKGSQTPFRKFLDGYLGAPNIDNGNDESNTDL
jgi:hypothetical protein